MEVNYKKLHCKWEHTKILLLLYSNNNDFRGTRISPIKSQDSGYSDSEEWCRSPNDYLTTAAENDGRREKSPYKGSAPATTTDYNHGSNVAGLQEPEICGLYPGGAREPDPWGRVKRAWSQEQAVWSRELKVNCIFNLFNLTFFTVCDCFFFFFGGGV